MNYKAMNYKAKLHKRFGVDLSSKSLLLSKSCAVPLLAAVAFFLSSEGVLAQGTVVGGSGNSATGNLSVVTGGFGNRATATNAVIVGGNSCTAGGQRSVVVGGTRNRTTTGGEGGVVVTGNLNTSSGNNAAVLTGRSNTASGVNSGIVAGRENGTSGENSAVLSGVSNSVSGENSIIIGGSMNTLGASNSALYASDINLSSGSGIIYLGDSSRGGTEKTESFSDNQLIGRFDNGFQFFASSTSDTPDFAIDSSGVVRAGGKPVLVTVEPLRLIRGEVSTAGNVVRGTGFTSTRTGTGEYTITFDTPFGGVATPTVTTYDVNGTEIPHINDNSTSQFDVVITDENGNANNSRFMFHVLGPE